jgi:heme oxygenase
VGLLGLSLTSNISSTTNENNNNCQRGRTARVPYVLTSVAGAVSIYHLLVLIHRSMRLFALATFVVGSSCFTTNAFVIRSVRPVIKTSLSSYQPSGHPRRHLPSLFASSTAETSSEPPSTAAIVTTDYPPILDELRTVAMKLHTREQAPREGQAVIPATTPPSKEPYIPTHVNYLQFLVDSHAIYTTLEDIVNTNDNLHPLRQSGIERTVPLTKDIAWMCTKYNLPRLDVGQAGATYVEELKTMMMRVNDNNNNNNVPKFMCHYYNYYFAHLAGGRMIGKQMSKLLLDGETLEFYKVSLTLSLSLSLLIILTERLSST